MTHRIAAPTWLIAVVILATYAAILAVLVAWAAGRTIPVDDLRVPDATAPPPAADRQQNPLGVWGFEVSAPGAVGEGGSANNPGDPVADQDAVLRVVTAPTGTLARDIDRHVGQVPNGRN